MDALLQTFLSKVVTQGALEVETASGHRFKVGDGSGSPIAARFTDAAAQRRLVVNPALALGELYMDERFVVTRGNIYDFLALVASNLAWQTAPGLARLHERLRLLSRRFAQRNPRAQSARNVGHHYDLDGRLYDLFLDDDRQYSCAYFERPGLSLEEAQLAKKRHLTAKLLVEPGHRVLDIGCGWGGLALYIGEMCRAAVTGVTLSEEQLGLGRQRAQKAGLGVDIRLQDYRDVAGPFDRIVSVGMFEHVGVPNYDTYFRKAAELLTADGVMVLHSIGRMEGPSATNPWIEKYIFPGGYIPALSEVLPPIERAGLVVADIDILRLHYAETLRLWRERFMARKPDAVAIYGERFCRMWEFYLAGCEATFRYSGMMVFQIQLARSLTAVPLTRDYIAEREQELRRRETEVARRRSAA